MIDDRRNKPWRKLRVIVEVTVPPLSNATEKDLAYLVRDALPIHLQLRRPIHDNAFQAVTRVKQFGPFWPMFLRAEKGIVHMKRKRKPDA